MLVQSLKQLAKFGHGSAVKGKGAMPTGSAHGGLDQATLFLGELLDNREFQPIVVFLEFLKYVFPDFAAPLLEKRDESIAANFTEHCGVFHGYCSYCLSSPYIP